MKRIAVAHIVPTQIKQKIYICENDGTTMHMVESLEIHTSDLRKEFINLIKTKNINDIRLFGPSQYIKGFEKQLTTYCKKNGSRLYIGKSNETI